MAQAIGNIAERLQALSGAFTVLLSRLPKRNEHGLVTIAEAHEAMRAAYALGVNEGYAFKRERGSNIEPDVLSKDEQRKRLAEETAGMQPSNIPDIDLDLAELGL